MCDENAWSEPKQSIISCEAENVRIITVVIISYNNFDMNNGTTLQMPFISNKFSGMFNRNSNEFPSHHDNPSDFSNLIEIFSQIQQKNSVLS